MRFFAIQGKDERSIFLVRVCLTCSTKFVLHNDSPLRRFWVADPLNDDLRLPRIAQE